MLQGITPVIFGDGEQQRDYLYVDDVAEANIAALDKGDGEIVNIATGVGTSVNDIYRELKKILNFPHNAKYAPPRTGEIYRTYLDTAKAEEILHWRWQMPFPEGLSRTVEWHKQTM